MKLCSRCAAEFLTDFRAQPWVDWGNDADDGAWRIAEELDDRWSPDQPLPSPGAFLIEVLNLALSRGHCVRNPDGTQLQMIPTTWHGDPICYRHLVEVQQRELRGR